MSQQNLSVYIRDHIAGSVAALRLCERIEDSPAAAEVAHDVARIRAEVERDQALLLDIRERLGIPRGFFRRALAVVAQVASNIKLRLESGRSGEVQLLHALDSLALGIEGKKALWSALMNGAESNPRLNLASYPNLMERADEQLGILHRLRADVARRAFAPGTEDLQTST